MVELMAKKFGLVELLRLGIRALGRDLVVRKLD